jgi:hypothetical protein
LKKSLIRIGLGVLVVVMIFLIVVAMQPSEFRVARTAVIAAPAEVVFAQVNDFHNWEAWSPWAKLDPAAKNSFDGPASGAGAKFSWAGNDKIGEGHMAITESHPSDLVRIKLDFIKPMEGTSMTEFLFSAAGNQTAVTWSMTGQHNFIEKGFCLFMNLDKMVGGDFEKGLASMKSVAEAIAKK